MDRYLLMIQTRCHTLEKMYKGGLFWKSNIIRKI